MTTIRPFAAGAYAQSRNTAQILGLKEQLNTLSSQLATGRVSDTYGGLGTGRSAALGAQTALSALDGYASVIETGQTRAKATVTSLTQIATLGTSLRTGLQSTSLDTTATKSLAANNLDAALDALNQSAGGVYLFGGRDGSSQPVLDSSTILNGTTSATGASLAGLKTLVAEQVKADLGSESNGRLTQTLTGTSLSLTEGDRKNSSAETRANFGFTIKGATATGAALTAATTPAGGATATPTFQQAPTEGQRFRVVVNQADGSQKTIDFTTRADAAAGGADTFPVIASAADAAAALNKLVAPGTLASVQSAAPGDKPPGPGLSLTFSDGSPAKVTIDLGTPPRQPAVGDTITVTLGMHDGNTTTLTLTAAASADKTSATTFEIGADASATAASLSATLDRALKSAAGTTLTVSATARAAQDMFSGSTATGLAPRRITFDASGVATGYTRTPRSDTVVWYQGEDAGGDARSTVSLQVGVSATVQIGARANEASIRSVLSGLATVALAPTGTGTKTDPTFQAVIGRGGTLLSAADMGDSVQDAVTGISLASARMSNMATTNTASKAALEDTVAGIEQASTEEVATKLLDLQNRLQASYQITASLSKLSLVNYIG